MRSTKLLTVLASSLAIGVTAYATPINGTVNFDGVATTNTGKLSDATAFTSISDVSVVAGNTGTYASVPVGTPATYTPFSFSAASVTPLWTFTYGGNVYSFDATSIHIVDQTAAFLNLNGNGFATINGVDMTPGTWSITDTHVGGGVVFTFGGSSAVMPATPDGGLTAVLLGLGLVAICLTAGSRRAAIV